jgi:signal peptidase I
MTAVMSWGIGASGIGALGVAALGVGAALLAGLAVALVRLRRRLVVVRIEGASMRPALSAGDRILVRRLAPARLAVDQVVVLERPRPGDLGLGWVWPPAGRSLNGREWIIKRIVAVAGDPVPAAVAATVGAVPGSVVLPGRVVVLGDNPRSSFDSRHVGYVPADRVLGVALRRVGERVALPAGVTATG